MLQVRTFDDLEDLNVFLKTIDEKLIRKIEYKVTSGGIDDYSEYFMVVYKV